MSEVKGALISAVVTFHGEGLIAHKTLLGLQRLRQHAEAQGCAVELVLVLDCADAETRRVVRASPVLAGADRIIEVAHGDQGAARNAGVAAARGAYVCLLDGDDYYSENWFSAALATLLGKSGTVVVHPEYVVSFGAVHAISRMPDLDSNPDYPLANLFSVHPWVCSSFARRELYLQHPFQRSDARETGFGFEDWHWNLEVLSHGARHVLAPQSALFYRRRSSSVLASHHAQRVQLRPSHFFDISSRWNSLLSTGSAPQAREAV